MQTDVAADGSRSLVDRAKAWLASHDPGAVDQTRALHIGIAFVLVIATGVATSRGLGLGLDIVFPMAGAITTMVLITFTPAASRRIEAVSFLKLFALTFAVLVAVLIIGPGDGEANAMFLKLSVVPLTGVSLYMRKNGMEGMRQGNVIIVVVTVAAILRPTHMETAWLMMAACQGGAIAALVRFGLHRPNALTIYADTVEAAGQAIGRHLHEVASAVREARPVPQTTDELLDQIRVRVRSALVNASAEAPDARNYLEAVRSLAYRLRVATQLLSACIPSPAPDADTGSAGTWRAPLAAAADQLARHLENGLAQPFPEHARMGGILARLRQAAMAPNLKPSDHLALLRAVTAFERLALVVTELTRLLSEGPEQWHASAAPAPQPPPPPATDGLSPFAKVAIQGLVATTITTGLDLILHLDHAYWATLTVIFVLGNSVGETYVRVRYRTVGTAIGVAIGLGCVVLLSDNVWILALLCLICQMISLVTVRDRYDIASAMIGFSVVVALHIVSGLDAQGMVARIYETGIGAGVALLVSWVVLPVYVADQIRDQVISMIKRCRTAFAASWPRYHAEGEVAAPRASTAAMSLELRVLADRLPHIGAETSLGHRSAADVITLVSTLEILTTYQALLEDAAERLSGLPLPEPLVTVLEAARARTLRAFDAALGEAPAGTDPQTAPDLDAAVRLAMDYVDDPKTRRLLPLMADYLSFSDAVLRPLKDLGGLLAASRPAEQRPDPAPSHPRDAASGTPHAA
ncbi:FUSC family protein [Aquabacter sp. L1I39]|uniref:FUSC family protein n=1 Tax=Aquabacter sp. L1I39 TaxID=2820278 RepID=UPI001ADBD947|nr:FUSC family protein [Aquabacter sp. L1I39]QTL04889.1 FUSC family protein [Aquabacter sp. L1I39]